MTVGLFATDMHIAGPLLAANVDILLMRPIGANSTSSADEWLERKSTFIDQCDVYVIQISDMESLSVATSAVIRAMRDSSKSIVLVPAELGGKTLDMLRRGGTKQESDDLKRMAEEGRLVCLDPEAAAAKVERSLRVHPTRDDG